MSIFELEIPEDRIARTLTCDIKIALKPDSEKPLITDCGFLRHNKAARELYGCPLTYRYKSQFRDKDATLHAQCRMVASKQGRHDYNSSSLNYLIRADGEGVWVRQDVTTFYEGDITYWLTALYPSSQHGLIDQCKLSDYGVTHTQIQDACGLLTIADIQALPANLTPALSLATIIPDGLKICKITGQATVWIGAVGAYLGRFLHSCQRCGVLWASNKAKPRNCTRRGTVSGDTGCGTTDWWQQ